MARGRPATSLPAPYLRTVRMRDGQGTLPDRYPFTLPWVSDTLEISFEQPVTILVGENGSGKSTLLEAIAALAGFGTQGGGNCADPDLNVDAPDAEALAASMTAGWLPKVGQGWFLKAQSFAAVSEQMQKDYLAFSHGEGFAEIIADRMRAQGIYLMDEPEAALSPRKQADLLTFLSDIQAEADSQVIIATHSPMLMAVPGAEVKLISHRGIDTVDFRRTDHFRLWSAFCADPEGFVSSTRAGDLQNLV